MGVQATQSNYQGMGMATMGRQPGMMRVPIRGNMQGPQQNSMYSTGGTTVPGPMGGQGMPGQTSSMYSTVGASGNPQSGPGGPGQANMGQYGTYQQTPMNPSQMISGNPGGTGNSNVGGASIMGQGYGQGYQGNPTMIGMRQQQPGYMNPNMSQGQMVQRPQYMTVSC